MTNWPIKKLGDLLTVQNGYAFDSKHFSPGGKIGLIRIRDLKGGVSTETRYDGPYDEEFIVSAGDYLIGMDGEFRCYEWKGDPALLNQRVCRLQGFGKSLEPRFLFYGINKFLKDIEDVTGYTTVKHLSSKSILAIEMSVPPLEEQKRIVALLDDATTRISELTECYEQARTHANNLFTSATHDVLESYPDCPVRLIKDVCEDVNVGHVGTSSNVRDSNGISFLMGKNIGPGFLKLDSLERVSKSFHASQKKSQLRDGDVVVVRIGNSGQAAKIPEGFGEANCSGLVIIKTPTGVLADFLVYYLNSPQGRQHSVSNARGSTRQTLNTKTIAETPIPVPTLSEQTRIVARLDAIRAKCSEMVSAYEVKLTAAKNLRQSILEAAFAGDL